MLKIPTQQHHPRIRQDQVVYLLPQGSGIREWGSKRMNFHPQLRQPGMPGYHLLCYFPSSSMSTRECGWGIFEQDIASFWETCEECQFRNMLAAEKRSCKDSWTRKRALFSRLHVGVHQGKSSFLPLSDLSSCYSNGRAGTFSTPKHSEKSTKTSLVLTHHGSSQQ